MWLLYVTFEDLLCLRHPNLSCHLLATRVNVDEFLMPVRLISNTTPGITPTKPDLDYRVSPQQRTKNATSVSSREITIQGDNRGTNWEHIHALTETIDNDCSDDKKPGDNISSSYPIVNRQSLERRDRDLNGRTIHQSHHSPRLNTMAHSRTQQCNRVRETMRDYGADQVAKNKLKCFKYPNPRREKSSSSTDVSQHGFQPRSNACVSWSNQISCQDKRRTTRANPDLGVTGSYSQPSDGLFANNKCVGREQRPAQRNPTEKNTRSQTRPSTHDRAMRETRGRENRTQCWVEEENFRPPPKEKRILGRQAERMLLKKKEGHTMGSLNDVSNVRSTAIRPTELFASRGKSAGELKRSAGPPTPRSETATTPDSSRRPKKLCVFQAKQQPDAAPVVSPDSGLDHTILSDSFDHVLSIDAQFDDPVQQNEMVRSNSADSSPVTISSGYESDSIQTCEAEIDKIFVNNKSRIGNIANVSSVTAFPNSSLHASAMDFSSTIFQSVPLPYGADNASDKLNQSFASSMSRTPEKPTGVLDRSFQIPDKSSVRNIRATETDFQSLPIFPRGHAEQAATRSSPVQRNNNNKLTKVARSMFEIIHDLQVEEEAMRANAVSKKKCKKVKRASPVRSQNGTVIKNNFQRGSVESLDENRLCISEESVSGRDKSDASMGVNAKSDCVPAHTPGVKSEPIVSENNEAVPSERHTDTLLLQPSTIDCQSPPNTNNSSNREASSHPGSSSVFVSRAPCTVNKAEIGDPIARDSFAQQERTNDLSPRVQPGTLVVKCLRRPLGTHSSDFRASDLPHSSSACFYEEYEGSPSVQPPTSVHQQVSPAEFLHFHSQPPQTSVVSHNAPHPDTGRLIIFDNGVTPYATARIPGCCTPKRDEKLDDHVYETIPGDEYLYEELMRMRAMGLLSKRLRKVPDMPGHFIPYEAPELPARNMNNNAPRQNNQFVVLRESRQNPHSVQNPPQPWRSIEHPRNGSTTWDGYSYPYNEGPPRYFTKWTPSDLLSYVDGIRQPAPKRRENFYLLLNNKQKRADFSESLEIETKLKNMGLLWGDRSPSSGPEFPERTPSREFSGESGQTFLQSTYV